jgi:hypothetical protein
VKRLREKAFFWSKQSCLVMTGGWSLRTRWNLSIVLEKYSVAVPPTIISNHLRLKEAGGHTVFFSAIDKRHLYLSNLTKDFIPKRSWWVCGSPEKG